MHHGQEMHDPGFIPLWRPDILLLTVCIAVLYWMLDGSLRSRFTGSGPIPLKRKMYFVIGLCVFYAAQGSPLQYYGHQYLFSAHMAQQSLLYFVMPPLILLGLPDWFVRRFIGGNGVGKAIAQLTRPTIAVLSFNVLFSFYHIPFIFNALWEHTALHVTYHVLLLLSAFQMWWVVACPLPEMDRISDLRKIAYMFISGALLLPACALIIFAKTAMYDAYADAPQVVFFLTTALEDQQLGGVIMKLMQEFAYGTALAYIFFEWYRKERKKDDDEPIEPHNDALVPSAEGRLNRA